MEQENVATRNQFDGVPGGVFNWAASMQNAHINYDQEFVVTGLTTTSYSSYLHNGGKMLLNGDNVESYTGNAAINYYTGLINGKESINSSVEVGPVDMLGEPNPTFNNGEKLMETDVGSAGGGARDITSYELSQIYWDSFWIFRSNISIEYMGFNTLDDVANWMLTAVELNPSGSNPEYEGINAIVNTVVISNDDGKTTLTFGNNAKFPDKYPYFSYGRQTSDLYRNIGKTILNHNGSTYQMKIQWKINYSFSLNK